MIVDLDAVRSAADSSAHELELYVESRGLRHEWFAQPDHIAFKFAGAADFEEGMNSIAVDTDSLSYIKLDDRRLASARLLAPVAFGSFGEIWWVELMEPRPEKVGKDVVGPDHIEFYYPNFEEVAQKLGAEGIRYDYQENPNHAWLSFWLQPSEFEIKLNNGTMAKMVAREEADGVSRFWRPRS